MFGGFCSCFVSIASRARCFFSHRHHHHQASNEAKCLGNSVMRLSLFVRLCCSRIQNYRFGWCTRSGIFITQHSLVYNIFIWFIGLLLFWRWMMLLFVPMSVVVAVSLFPTRWGARIHKHSVQAGWQALNDDIAVPFSFPFPFSVRHSFGIRIEMNM